MVGGRAASLESEARRAACLEGQAAAEPPAAHPTRAPQDFHLCCLAGDQGAQLEALERCKALPAFGAAQFARAVALARAQGAGASGEQGGSTDRGCLEVVRAAEAARLQRLAQQAPLDYAAVASVRGG